MSTEKKSLDYMTYYRGFAILMIVLVHCVTTFLNRDSNYYPYTYYLFAHSTDIFLFISGFLFEFLQHKNYTYRTFISKKVNRLVIPYLFWAVPISLLLFVLKGFDIKYFIYTICTGLGHGNDAHWYIPFIFILFVISPIFTLLQRKNLLYTILFPVSLFVSLTSGRAIVNEFYPVVMLLNLLGFFILGMFFSHNRTLILSKLYKYDWIFILCGFVICLIAAFFDFSNPKPVLESISGYFQGRVMINYYALNRLFFCIGFLLLFYRLDKEGFKFHILEKLAHYSFGIYFCHLYILRAVAYVMRSIYQESGGGIYLIMCFLLVLGLSIVLIYILRNIKITRNIIGV